MPRPSHILPNTMIKAELPGQARKLAFWGGFKSRVRLSNSAWARIGFNSISVLKCVRFHNAASLKGKILDVGNYCEFAEAEILLAGEHTFDRDVNIVFSQNPVLKSLLHMHGYKFAAETKGLVSLGHNVILSQAARVLSGVSIADSSVVASGAVVTKNFDRLSIVGGVPATLIKTRPQLETEWYTLDPFNLYCYLINQSPSENQLSDIELEFTVKEQARRIVDYDLDAINFKGQKLKKNKWPNRFAEYMNQAVQSSNSTEWCFDPSHLL